MNRNNVEVLHAARATSAALGQALEAVRTMNRPETWAEREQRLAEGRSHPTAWPLKLSKPADDGITIPERRALLKPYRPPMRRGFFDGMTGWLRVAYGSAVAFVVIVGALVLS